jgi:hypothetical protein
MGITQINFDSAYYSPEFGFDVSMPFDAPAQLYSISSNPANTEFFSSTTTLGPRIRQKEVDIQAPSLPVEMRKRLGSFP